MTKYLVEGIYEDDQQPTSDLVVAIDDTTAIDMVSDARTKHAEGCGDSWTYYSCSSLDSQINHLETLRRMTDEEVLADWHTCCTEGLHLSACLDCKETFHRDNLFMPASGCDLRDDETTGVCSDCYGKREEAADKAAEEAEAAEIAAQDAEDERLADLAYAEEARKELSNTSRMLDLLLELDSLTPHRTDELKETIATWQERLAFAQRIVDDLPAL